MNGNVPGLAWPSPIKISKFISLFFLFFSFFSFHTYNSFESFEAIIFIIYCRKWVDILSHKKWKEYTDEQVLKPPLNFSAENSSPPSYIRAQQQQSKGKKLFLFSFNFNL